MRYQSNEQKQYRTELKKSAAFYRKQGMTMEEIAEEFNKQNKTKLSGAKTKWSNYDVNYLLYQAPNGHKATKAATSTPVSDEEELLREALNSNMNVNAKIKLIKRLINV